MSNVTPRIWFQSAPRSFDRGDSRSTARYQRLALFQSAPRSFDRGDLPGAQPPARDRVSIRTPVLRPGRPKTEAARANAKKVSIRTPVLRPGRLSGSGGHDQTFTFQSAPRSFDRGDTCFSRTRTPFHGFQSAPRSFDRGDQPSYPSKPGMVFQSAPRSFDRGDGTSLLKRLPVIGFQSAPRSFDRGDSASQFAPRRLTICFNPHPGPSTGATCAVTCGRARWVCFNPHPGPSTGATSSLPVSPLLDSVSIRTPVLRPGRHCDANPHGSA